MATDREVAAIIYSQIGGDRFKVMTGAHSFSAVEQGISFKLPRNKYMFIKLNGRDLYDVSLWRAGHFRGDKWIQADCKKKTVDVYAEDLQNTFTEMTGLYTSL
ncbi:MAG: hypothetical protein M0R77_12750 [Gammaproteobacteria bacterium]|nr:hypothetical protein [Gammaproteobacteria bacterium]